MNYSLTLEDNNKLNPLVRDTSQLTTKFRDTIRRFRSVSFIKTAVSFSQQKKEEGSINLFLASASQLFLYVLNPLFSLPKHENIYPAYDHSLLLEDNFSRFKNKGSLSEKWDAFKETPFYKILCILFILFGGIFLFSIVAPTFPMNLFINVIDKMIKKINEDFYSLTQFQQEYVYWFKSGVNQLHSSLSLFKKNLESVPSFFEMIKRKYNELSEKAPKSFFTNLKNGFIAVVSALWKIFKISLFYFICLPVLLIAYFLNSFKLYKFIFSLFQKLSPAKLSECEKIISSLDLIISKEKQEKEFKIYAKIKKLEKMRANEDNEEKRNQINKEIEKWKEEIKKMNEVR